MAKPTVLGSLRRGSFPLQGWHLKALHLQKPDPTPIEASIPILFSHGGALFIEKISASATISEFLRA
jgi:hypothetical protein